MSNEAVMHANQTIGMQGSWQIESSLQSYWRGQFSGEVPTYFPGMLVDHARQSRWAELWVQSSRQRKARVGGIRLLDVSVVLHLFAQRNTQPGVMRELVDEAVGVLSLKTLVIRDFRRTGGPVVGYLKLFEAQTRWMSDQKSNESKLGVDHTVITCEGLAQMIELDVS